MQTFKHLKKSFRKGSFFVKCVKFLRLFQHSWYVLINKKIGDYPEPPKNIQEIGFLDKRRLIHTRDEYRKFFNEENLYNDGKYSIMKPGIVSLVGDGDKILLKKSFSGFQKYNKFYNELICLDRLHPINEIPGIDYVDYSACTIYMEYIDGITVSKLRSRNTFLNNNELLVIENEYQSLLEKVHSRSIIIYDLKVSNMMKSQSSFHLIDFADSVYFGNDFFRIFEIIKFKEVQKLKQELHKYGELMNQTV